MRAQSLPFAPNRLRSTAPRRGCPPSASLAHLSLAHLVGCAAVAHAAAGTPLGRRVSPPLVALVLAAGTAPLFPGVPATPLVSAGLPFAVALALLPADLRQLLQARQALCAFALASLATVAGTFLAAHAAPLGAEGWRLAACLCATYIGGSLNFAATASALRLPGELAAAAMTLDNLATALFMGLLLAIPEPPGAAAAATARPPQATPASCAAAGLASAACAALAHALAPPSCVLAVAALLACALAAAVGLTGRSPARLFAGAETGSAALLLLFFASLGASTDVAAAVRLGGPAAAFIAVQLSSALGLTLLLGSALRLPRRLLLLASNAAVGGPATAASMAVARGWGDMVPVGVLLGTLGYAVGTAVGLVVGGVLSRV